MKSPVIDQRAPCGFGRMRVALSFLFCNAPVASHTIILSMVTMPEACDYAIHLTCIATKAERSLQSRDRDAYKSRLGCLRQWQPLAAGVEEAGRVTDSAAVVKSGATGIKQRKKRRPGDA